MIQRQINKKQIKLKTKKLMELNNKTKKPHKQAYLLIY